MGKTVTADGASPLGNLLRTRRLAASLTQEALAEIAGVSARAIADLERGVIRAPRRDTLEMLAAALELTPEEKREWQQLRATLSSRERSRSPAPDLPHPPNALVGRRREVDALIYIIRGPDSRLVTLTGPGGVGKTRVALEAGRELSESFRDGVRFLELASVRNPDLLVPVIAQHFGVRDGDSNVIRQRLSDILSRRETLLILDNFEHLQAASSVIAELLAETVALKILVTSRAGLHLSAEHEFPLAPLPLPDWDNDQNATHLETYPAIELFVQRCRQVIPDFTITPEASPTISAICSRLDGLPLAIELAAARVKVLSPQQILERLTDRLGFLTAGLRDAPDRHRTMREAIAWSYDLLAPDDQRLFRQLSVFVGGWTLDAAEATAQSEFDVIDGLSSLANDNLIHQMTTSDGQSRFRMLETVREFGLEKLEELGEIDDARRRHGLYFLDLIETVEPDLKGARQSYWVNRLDDDLANLRTALEWSHQQQSYPELPVRLAGALVWFWESRGYLSEGFEWLSRALAREHVGLPIRMRALAGAGWLAHLQRDSLTAKQLLEESLDLARRLDDRQATAWTLHLLGRVAYFDGDPTTARNLADQSLDIAREIGDEWLRGWAFHLLALAAHIERDFPTAREYYETSLEIRDKLGYQEGIGTVRGLMGMLSLGEGDDETALAMFRKSLATIRELGSRWLAINMIANIVAIATERGDLERATRLAGFVAAMSKVVGADPIPIADSAYRRGMAAISQRLGTENYDQAWAEGQGMSMDEAIDEALSVDQPG